MKSNERIHQAMALIDAGLPASEVARRLGYKSGNSVRVMVFRLREAEHANRKQLYLAVTRETYADITALAKEWECSRAEVIRTLVLCGIEDIKNEEED